MAALLLIGFLVLMVGVLGVLAALMNEVKARQALEDELERKRVDEAHLVGVTHVRATPPPLTVVRQVRIVRVRRTSE